MLLVQSVEPAELLAEQLELPVLLAQLVALGQLAVLELLELPLLLAQPQLALVALRLGLVE